MSVILVNTQLLRSIVVDWSIGNITFVAEVGYKRWKLHTLVSETLLRWGCKRVAPKVWDLYWCKRLGWWEKGEKVAHLTWRRGPRGMDRTNWGWEERLWCRESKANKEVVTTGICYIGTISKAHHFSKWISWDVLVWTEAVITTSYAWVVWRCQSAVAHPSIFKWVTSTSESSTPSTTNLEQLVESAKDLMVVDDNSREVAAV